MPRPRNRSGAIPRPSRYRLARQRDTSGDSQKRERALRFEELEARSLLTASAGLSADMQGELIATPNIAFADLATSMVAPGALTDFAATGARLSQRSVSPADSGGGASLSSPYAPAAMLSAYGFNNIYFPGAGGTFIKGDGAGQTIAIVIAYQAPNLVADLHTFSVQYGLPEAQITICNQAGSTDPATLPAVAPQSWGLEASLDTQWIHALAPAAKILVVQASSNSLSNLFTAVDTARKSGTGSLSALPSATVVSMSWGAAEYSGDSSNSYFTTPPGKSGVVFVASTGDAGTGGEYPAADSRVLAVGGTTLTINNDGTYGSESGWSGSSGGFSPFNTVPTYQQSIQPFGSPNTGAKRMTPDVSLNGSSSSRVYVYDSTDYGGWVGVYGTSVSAPCWAALVAIADQGRAIAGSTPLTGSQVLVGLYATYTNGNYSYAFHDVAAGANAGYSSGIGYDLVTGLGSPRANVIAATLAGVTQTPTPIAPTGTVATASPTFQWSAIGGASGYYLTIIDTTTQTTIANALPVTGTSYTPATALSNGHSFQWKVQARDESGALGAASSLLSFTVSAPVVNHAPSGANNSVTTLEDTAYTIGIANFGFSDPNDTPANSLLAVKVTTLPTIGSLVDNGVAVSAGQFVSLSDITAGLLKFVPVGNASGVAYASFTFQVQDNGGVAGGGIDLDPTPNTLTINVTPVNDAPAGSNNTVTTLEDTVYVFGVTDFGFSDPNDTPANGLQAVKITSLPAVGALIDNGVAVAVGQFVSLSDITAGLLKFVPVGNASGVAYASFTFQVQDNGGVTGGGTDLDPTPNTLTINVTPVNDAPTGVAIVGAATALRGEAQTFTLTADDEPDDVAVGFTFTIDWGDGSDPQSVAALSGVQVTHAFNVIGPYSVSVTATDQSAASSVPATLGVQVNAVQLRPNAQNPGLVDLVWSGTSGADQVQFSKLPGATIRVQETMLNGAVVNNVNDVSGVTGRVIASGRFGNDQLDARGLTLPATLDGGAGDNTVYGGNGGDLLIGGSNGGEGKQGSNVIIAGNGDNTIYGNDPIGRRGASGGNNLIVGGPGHDTIYGNFGVNLVTATNPNGNGGEGGQNLIVGGGGADTIYTSQIADGAEGGHGSIVVTGGTNNLNQVALLSILSEWRSADTYNDKIMSISGTPTGLNLNGSNFLAPGSTILDDGVVDQVFSDTNGQASWLQYKFGQDVVTRVKATDTLTNVA